MNIFKTPQWVKSHIYKFESINKIDDGVYHQINLKLDAVQSSSPEVSIIIAAWNEEENIMNCISSLANLKTVIPFEIIVVNNNSKDGTQAILERLHVRTLFQKIQGCGPARQLGQEHAMGKYILLADADCIYAECWLDKMISKLKTPDVVCVYGRYSFIDCPNYPRWQLYLLERMKDCVAELRHFKRPYLNAYGISMGYIKDLGLKVKYVDYKIWGDDGRLCFDLMKYGKVKQVKANTARAWTYPRTLQRDGTLIIALRVRIKKECDRFFSLFIPHPPHDTKTSSND
ncbi:glycosyltransferase family 2 protein [Albibacterium profundi]|uniref:Glycosyltransferase family A protein n=1 Tax=Albibacterium profundi TaxID=3134906 RepID=A0ABV5CAX6_9SPHI